MRALLSSSGEIQQHATMELVDPPWDHKGHVFQKEFHFSHTPVLKSFLRLQKHPVVMSIFSSLWQCGYKQTVFTTDL